ncbi:hypothetical protein AAMO2058_001348200 [Amorphochlora amoebiformis]
MTSILASLRRSDPDISRVLLTTKFSALYELRDMHWRAMEVAGPLFFVEKIEKNTGRISHRIIILNRKSLQNFTLDLEEKMTLETQQTYLFVEVSKKIYGFWFYDYEERDRCHNLLKRLTTKKRQMNDSTPRKPKKSSVRQDEKQRTNPEALEELLTPDFFGGGEETTNEGQLFFSEEDGACIDPQTNGTSTSYAISDTKDPMSPLYSLPPAYKSHGLYGKSLPTRDVFKRFLHSLVEDPQIFETLYGRLESFMLQSSESS